MAYERRMLRRQKVRYNNDNDDNPLVYQLVVDDEKVTPTSATIAIYKPGSTTAVLAATAMTVSGSLVTYSVTTTTVADFPVDTGYRADIVVTYNTKTYQRHIMFDVVKYLFDFNIAYDQIVALDDGIQGMEHNEDDDFSELIGAVKDNIQIEVESKIFEDDSLLIDAILDSSKLAVPARYRILSQIWMNKGEEEKAEKYMEMYKQSIQLVLSTIKYDTDGDGQEASTPGGIQSVRLMM